eukprot:GHVS01056917.1.p1 GENE.GHVS01056917.1~~GHVS01056917.1.p1  ORF type:complete len:245 (+),score=61.30 GHVS01056917.1:7-741(+)
MVTVGRGAVEGLLLAVAGVSCLSLIARTDANLPIALFLWWTFFSIPQQRKYRQQRVMIIALVLSIIPDVLFILYWPFQWFRPTWMKLSPASVGVHIFVIMLAIVELLLKALICASLLVPSRVEEEAVDLREWLEDTAVGRAVRNIANRRDASRRTATAGNSPSGNNNRFPKQLIQAFTRQSGGGEASTVQIGEAVMYRGGGEGVGVGGIPSVAGGGGQYQMVMPLTGQQHMVEGAGGVGMQQWG